DFELEQRITRRPKRDVAWRLNPRQLARREIGRADLGPAIRTEAVVVAERRAANRTVLIRSHRFLYLRTRVTRPAKRTLPCGSECRRRSCLLAPGAALRFRDRP